MKDELLLASCRQNFTDTVFSGPPQFQTEARSPLGLEQVLNACAGQTVHVYVHGYHNSFDAALAAYKTMRDRMTGKIPAKRIGFFWCGSWAALGFLMAVWRTNAAAEALCSLVTALKVRGCKVIVETHSLGARVALQALKDGAKVDRLILTAPAVNADCLSPGGEFYAAIANAGIAWVLSSERDRVLKLAYWAASGFKKALGLIGPNPIPCASNVDGLDCTKEIAEHSDYKNAEITYWPPLWQ